MDNANQTGAVVRKRKAAWDGIRLEHCQLRPGELPRHRHREHVILLSLTDGCRGELITAKALLARRDLPLIEVSLHSGLVIRVTSRTQSIGRSLRRCHSQSEPLPLTHGDRETRFQAFNHINTKGSK